MWLQSTILHVPSSWSMHYFPADSRPAHGYKCERAFMTTTTPPLILVSPSIEKKGVELGDLSTSLSDAYQRAVMGAGGLPLTMPCTTSRELVAECVRRCDGVLLPGGDDVHPELYAKSLPDELRKTVVVDDGERDLRELMVIDEVFRQRKPLLAICRGHQILNVALGGTLLVDIPTQHPQALNHRRQDLKREVVHEVQLQPDSLLARVTGRQTLGVNSTHHQAVDRVAEPLAVVGTSPDGIVEAMQLKADARHLLPYLVSVQFHPERLVDRYPEHMELFRSFTQACVLNRDEQ
jgi:putative glutamine amidotransferase